MFEEEELLSRFNLPPQQRKELRIVLNKPAIVEIKKWDNGSESVACTLVDLSVGGVKVIFSGHLPDLMKSDELLVRFELAESFSLHANMVWVDQFDSCKEYGLSWIHMDEWVQEQLFEEIKQIYFSTRQQAKHQRYLGGR